jgi:hypothetical protein
VSHPREGWERLAALLRDRRVELDPQYKNRLKFAADTGLNERLISDLENARRTSYRETTLRAVEGAYRWKPGSIERALTGGEPVEAAGSVSEERLRPFESVSEWPALAVAGERGTLTATRESRRVRQWFTTGVERMGKDMGDVLAAVDLLEELAEVFGYDDLSKLLIESGLVQEREPDRDDEDPFTRFEREYQRIRASPHLSSDQRKELDAQYREALKQRGKDAEKR